MKRDTFRIFILLFLIELIISFSILGQVKRKDNSPPLYKATGEPSYAQLNINNLSTWFRNNGESDVNPDGNAGFLYPRDSWYNAVFQTGLLWGGKVDGEVRVGGSKYHQATVPGRVIKNANGKWEAVNPQDTDVRIYRVRRDYATAQLNDYSERYIKLDPKEIRKNYKKDWMEWPASQGAPFEDKNGDGVYDPLIDIPGVPGADQTIWSVCNDFDSELTNRYFFCSPMGIEEQITIWAYKSTGTLGDMYFRKYILINKNLEEKPFTDMYVSIYMDADVGDPGDDFIGCDSILNLGYTYNATNYDYTYRDSPPAVGISLLQGPLVNGLASDTAIYKGKYFLGKKNLPLSTAYFYHKSSETFGEPHEWNYEEATLGNYKQFQGIVYKTGIPYFDPTTGKFTRFPYSGDPVNKTGWYENSASYGSNDRRNGIATGPFNIAYGDTQEVIFAEIIAGFKPGITNLTAINKLKEHTRAAYITYDHFFDVIAAPHKPVVTVSTKEDEITLSWDKDTDVIQETEGFSKYGFKFEGYNIYQIPAPGTSLSDAVRIATFDIINDVKTVIDSLFDPSTQLYLDRIVAYGSDSGIKRSISIFQDALNSNLPLNYGQKYYFAVTSYSYNEKPAYDEKVYENELEVIEVIPQADFVKEDISRINVFPNPYYAYNPQELNKYQRFVTFSHLPAAASIKIFNLAGQLVAHIKKLYSDQFVQWDLNNDAGYMVADGLYIAYIEMPELGETKILKLAIIHEQPILDRF
ncbi:MAG: hypothetical protein WC055_09050 [Melioribacteraceae bacterium]